MHLDQNFCLSINQSQVQLNLAKTDPKVTKILTIMGFCWSLDINCGNYICYTSCEQKHSCGIHKYYFKVMREDIIGFDGFWIE